MERGMKKEIYITKTCIPTDNEESGCWLFTMHTDWPHVRPSTICGLCCSFHTQSSHSNSHVSSVTAILFPTKLSLLACSISVLPIFHVPGLGILEVRLSEHLHVRTVNPWSSSSFEVATYGSYSCHSHPFCPFRSMTCESVIIIPLVIGVLGSHISAAVASSNSILILDTFIWYASLCTALI